MVKKELTPLPKWIKWTQSKGHHVTLEPLKCTNCETEWYPRINGDGGINLPSACANNNCRTAAYRKVRK